MIRRRHLRLAARFVAHRFRALHPFEVQAALLNACNLRCAYCSCPDVKTTVLDTEQWLDVIRRGSAARHHAHQVPGWRADAAAPTSAPSAPRRRLPASSRAGHQRPAVRRRPGAARPSRRDRLQPRLGHSRAHDRARGAARTPASSRRSRWHAARDLRAVRQHGGHAREPATRSRRCSTSARRAASASRPAGRVRPQVLQRRGAAARARRRRRCAPCTASSASGSAQGRPLMFAASTYENASPRGRTTAS